MMSRNILVLAVLALLVSGVEVDALAEGPRESCRILVDATGDAEGSGGAGVIKMKSTDIVSADLASTPDYLTATVRVADLYARSDEAQMIGLSLQFDVGTTRFGFQTVESTTREEYTVWRRPAGGGGSWGWVGYATGAWNDDDSAVHITMPLKKLRIAANSRATAGNLVSKSFYGYDAAVIASAASADEAVGTGSYRLGSPSCAPAPVEPCRDPRPEGIPKRDRCPGGS